MTETITTIQSILCAGCRAEEKCYVRALQLAQSLLPALERGEETAEALKQVLAILDEVAGIEGNLQEAKRAWKELGSPKNPELSAVLARVATLVRELISCIHVVEQTATSKQASLGQELDTDARVRKMQRAYGRIP